MTYLDELGQKIREQLDSRELPDEESDDLFRMYAVLLLAKREAVSREDVHNVWVAWMLSRDQVHESMVPFTSLPKNVQDEDSPFVKAIREVARHHEHEQTS